MWATNELTTLNVKAKVKEGEHNYSNVSIVDVEVAMTINSFGVDSAFLFYEPSTESIGLMINGEVESKRWYVCTQPQNDNQYEFVVERLNDLVEDLESDDGEYDYHEGLDKVSWLIRKHFGV